jgi:DNA-binding MarR family transcriptional regulator
MACRQLVDNLHVRLRERGWDDVRPTFGYVLLAVRSAPTTTSHIAALMGMSKQAASKLIADIAAVGYVTSQAHLVSLTPRGEQLLAAVESIYRDLEQEWAEIVGRERLEQHRADLLAVVLAGSGDELPAIRPT